MASSSSNLTDGLLINALNEVLVRWGLTLVALVRYGADKLLCVGHLCERIDRADSSDRLVIEWP